MEATGDPKKLEVAKAQAVKESLDLNDPSGTKASPSTDSELDRKAQSYVDALLSMDPSDLDARDSGKAAIETMGADLQRKAAKQSELLKQPLRQMASQGEEGGGVAKSLVDLKMKVEELDPSKLDLQPGWFSRALGTLPGVGTPLKRYFTRYESAQTVIAAIIRSLENGRDQLGRDSLTLVEDQKVMRDMTGRLEKAIKLGQLIDQKLQYKLDRELEAGSPQHKFVAEELLFPLRQRLIDLQQQLAVNQQGVLAAEIVIRNNKELVRGVNRALNVTVSALQVGVTVAIALANQKNVLDKITSVNDTTSDLIAGTAARVRSQGVEIHKQAASSTINIDTLKAAFADINAAMKDLSEFRTQALPQMAASVLELDKLTAEAGKAIEKMEEGNKARPRMAIEV